MFFNNTKVEIIQPIDVHQVEWCNEAVLFRVKNGKGALTHRISEAGEDYDFFSQLLLNNKPILQGKYPSCPTCAGMLATGYGIENIDSPELKKVRECLNTEYKGIMEFIKLIKPLLGLLNDGYYVLADTKLCPTDGQGNFFYTVPNELTYNAATCDAYYDSNFYSSAYGIPAYIYPTQSAEIIQEKRIDDYVEIFRKSDNPPRALAYYEQGFVCALLDGHHKACAASILGERLNCLTIIPPNQFLYAEGEQHRGGDTLLREVGFAGIMISVKKGARLKEYQSSRGFKKENFTIPAYNITGRQFSERYSTCYPTIESLAGIMNAEVDITGDIVEYAKKLIQARNEENVTKLEYLMAYLAYIRMEEAYAVAKMILDEDKDDDFLPRLPVKNAIKALLHYHNDETEQYMIDYLANHTPSDECWDLVDDYWK